MFGLIVFLLGITLIALVFLSGFAFWQFKNQQKVSGLLWGIIFLLAELGLFAWVYSNYLHSL